MMTSNRGLSDMFPKLEARDILSHLLSRLQDPTEELSGRYADWIDRNPKLEEALFNRLRPQVLRYLQQGTRSCDAMRSIGGDLRYEGAAVYLHSINGLDRRVRIYVGQSLNLSNRLKQHFNFRFRRDNPSLHYHALQNSSFDVFSVLATLPPPVSPEYHQFPGIDQPQLLLNVLEMWCCLLLRSLPVQTLETWLPPSTRIQPQGAPAALNIANPLDHGERGGRQWVDLSTSEDPLVREYVKAGERNKNQVEHDVTPVDKKEDRVAFSCTVQSTTVMLLGAAVVIGYMLLRSSSGPASRPRIR